jgi:hypothetical protein
VATDAKMSSEEAGAPAFTEADDCIREDLRQGTNCM